MAASCGQDYLTFYEAELPEAVTAATFARITSDDPLTMRGLLAGGGRAGGGAGALCHHRTCWKDREGDLSAGSLRRARASGGGGLGRALIGAVYDRADAAGAPAVYWLTQEFNATARRLYDRIGVLTPFIEYDRPS